jgi:hypothetical protein
MGLTKLVKDCAREIKAGNEFSLFAFERIIMLPKPDKVTGRYSYSQNTKLRKQFNSLLQDEDFSKANYTDVTGGQFNQQYESRYWSDEISQTIISKNPENLIFYLRAEPEIIASRIFIPKSDFYGGLTNEEIESKYPKDVLKKMDEYLRGITVSKDVDGKIRVPFGDLNYAYRKATGQKTHPEEWD